MKILTKNRKKTMQPAALWPCLGLMCVLAWLGPTAYAQNAKLDLSRLDKLASKASKVQDVNLDGPMLKQIGMSHLHLTGPPAELKDMAGRLQGIYVRKYEFDKPGEYSKADVESLLKQLHSGGWNPMVTDENKKTGEIKNVYLMNEGGETIGMAVVKLAPMEIDVVNIVGPINLGALGGIGGHSGRSEPKLQHRSPSDQKPDPQEGPK
ncbi:MAG TPA: DUF4252 domain-containing protein [Terriglobia bacterium]|nr:DUF4252 domain-containing protein [Terriglobia bacterium]